MSPVPDRRFAAGPRVGSLALWQVVSLQGQWHEHVEGAFIHGSWSWHRRGQCLPECLGWRPHQGCTMMPGAENVLSQSPDALHTAHGGDGWKGTG